jgi:hypothetical protein
MKQNMEKNSNSRPFARDLSPYILFFLVSFIYFGFFAGYIYFYQEKTFLFLTTSDFLKGSLNQPGGLLLYAGKLLSSFYYFPVAGAFIVSVIISLTVYFTAVAIISVNGSKSKLLPLIPGILLFLLQCDYRFQLFNSLGLLLQVMAFGLAVKHLKGWLAVAIAPLLYYITGGFSLVYFLMISVHFILSREKSGLIRVAVLWLMSLTLFFISEEFLFYQRVKTLILFPFSPEAIGSQIYTFGTLIALISFLPFLAGIRFRFNLVKSDWIKEAGLMILTASILVFIAFQCYDIKTKKYFHVEKLFYDNAPEEVISYNLSNPSNNILTGFLNNIALSEAGKLNDQLFWFPQSKDGQTLFLKWEMIGEILRRGGYFYYTVGMINEAHRWAYENMVMDGITPEGLKMLIRTELINGNHAMAAKYISELKNTLFYKSDAKKFQRLLFRDDLIDADPDLGAKRRIRLKSDFFVVTGDPLINIERILATDSLNKKAFDYKMAFLLLKKDYAGISKEVPGILRFYGSRIPVHIEEALVVFKELKNSGLQITGIRNINPATELAFKNYLETFQKYNNDPKLAEPALRKQFGKTFWYYAFYK